MTPVYVVIVAGGSGARMGTAIPKQFLDLCGKPVLYHTIKAFADAVPGAHLILVLPAAQMSYAQIVLRHFEARIDIELVSGGDTRYASVQAGLASIPAGAIVLVHDGVRPLISAALIQASIQKAGENGSAIPVISAVDSMRMVVDDGAMSLPINRSNVRIVQTPQAFKAEVILPAFKAAYNEKFTDEATVVEYSGQRVFFIDGERHNIKITTPEDLVIAEALMNYFSDKHPEEEK